jgi:phosphoribosyl-ATP pyrophosphohydrolase
VHETADVIYHLLVTLESAGINFDDIIRELKKREGTSGFEEKRNR